MGPKSRKVRTGTFHEERLSQMEDNVKTVQREKQQEILDEKRNPSAASISQEEDPSTMKQASRWPGVITMVVNINRMSSVRFYKPKCRYKKCWRIYNR